MITRIPAVGLAASLLLLLTSVPLSSCASPSPSDVPTDTPVSQILDMASSALSSGSSQDALAYYDLAVARDPSNYLTLFKRGATQLSLGRVPQASADFDKVLALKPGFEGALMQRAKLRARNADWAGARADYKSGGKEAEAKAIDEAEGAATLAAQAEKNGDWSACIGQAGAAIVVAGGSAELRRLRARCRLEKGEVAEAVTDMQHATQLAPGAADVETAALKVSALTFYSLGEADRGLEGVKRCLHSDPDSRECARLFKREKRIDKELKKARAFLEKRTFTGAVKTLVGVGTGDDAGPGLVSKVKEDIKELRAQGHIHPKAPDALVGTLLEMTCNAYLEMNNLKRGAPHCAELLTHNPTALPGLIHSAETQLAADDFEGALRTLRTAEETHGGTNKIRELTQKANTLLRRSKQKDYYKVLGVSRDASTKEIKRAYLRLSKQHHPDKVPGGDGAADRRKAAETKMAAVNEAYEVLKDDDLRARFDAGDDPNDPEGQSRGHGGPFHGSPFGAGGAGGAQFMFQSGGGFPGGFAQQMFGGGGPGGGFQFQF